MRAFLHVLSVLLLVPYMVLAILFLLLGHAIAGGGLLGFLGALLDEFIWMMPWGLLGFALLVLTLLVLGLRPATLWLAGLLVGLLATASMLVVLIFPGDGVDAGSLLFLLPCAIALGLGFWICLAERGSLPGVAPAAQPVPP